MKIAVIGHSGSGKSTLAKFLGKLYNIDVLHLDSVHWLPGWNERSAVEKNVIVTDFMNSHSSWVIDGNYFKQCYERRLSEADVIVFLNFNRFNCLCRAFRRFLRYRGSTREDMGKGCNEKMDFKFIRWILWEGRTSERYNKMFGAARRYSDKFIEIRNQKQLDAYKSKLKGE
ncbi:MAG: DNA topology modulation protein [Ruminococcus sp.]|nr:DNA topology modulation protein [Ruminococcus sp.]